MRVGLNLLFLIPGIVGGTETYAVSLVKALAAIDKENEYLIFLNRESLSLELAEASNLQRINCPIHAVHRPARYAWEQFFLPLQLRNFRVDLVHSLGYIGPLISHCPRLVTIPDLNYIALKDTMPPVRRHALHFFSSQSARKSTRVITISHFSKEEIKRVLGLTSDQITVTLLGPGHEPACTSSTWEAIQNQYGLYGPYVVAFGGRSLHKNISRLIMAFIQACKDLPHRLVLIGHLPPSTPMTIEEVGIEASLRIHALGYIPQAHIGPILGHGDLFILPSLYEGFGMPVLEAQTVGVAVACSTSGSLPEVGGDGAVFFDPRSVDNMAHTIHRCLLDANLRAELRRRGAENVRRFSWEKTARETLAVYQIVYSACVS